MRKQKEKFWIERLVDWVIEIIGPPAGLGVIVLCLLLAPKFGGEDICFWIGIVLIAVMTVFAVLWWRLGGAEKYRMRYGSTPTFCGREKEGNQ